MEGHSNPPAEQPQVNEVNPPGDFRFALREGEPDDVRFVSESWRRSYSDSNWARCPGGKDEYIATQKAVIAQALSTSRVLVAFPEAPDRRPEQILGWVCYRRPSVVHYLFVKPYYRRAGVATSLLARALGDLVLARAHDELGVGEPLIGLPSRIFTSHGWRRPTGKGDGINALMALAKLNNIVVEYNPALIFGGAP